MSEYRRCDNGGAVHKRSLTLNRTFRTIIFMGIPLVLKSVS